MSDLKYSIEIEYFSSGRIDPGFDRAARAHREMRSNADYMAKVRERSATMAGQFAAKQAREEARERARKEREEGRARREAEHHVQKWSRAFGHGAEHLAAGFNRAFDSAASSLVSTLATAGTIAGATAAAGIGKALHEGIGFASFVESAQLGIATVKTALGDIPFPEALRQSAEATEQLRRAAARLPGEFKDVLEMFQSLGPAAQQLGMSDEHAVKMSTRGVAMAAALGINQATFAHELSSALSGKVTSAMPLARKLGLHQSEWSKLKPEQRLDFFDKLFQKADPGIQAYQSSWAGLTSSAKDNSRNVAKSFASPLFGSLKGELERGLDWFAANEDAVHAWATRLGVGIDHAFHVGLDAVHRWYGPVSTFGTNLYTAISGAFGVAAPYLRRLESVSLAFMQDPQALEKIAHVASALVALRAGTGVLGAGFGALGGLVGHAGDLATAFKALEKVGFGAAELGIAGGVGAAAILGLAVATEGAVHALTDSTSAFHDAATSQAASIGVVSASLAQELVALDAATRPARDALGTGLLFAVGSAIGQFTVLAEYLNTYNDVLARHADWLAAKFGILRPDAPIKIERDDSFYTGFVKAINVPFEPEKLKFEPPHVTNHITNNVRVDVETNADPNRIAAVVTDKLMAMQQRAQTNPLDALYRR